VGDGRYLLGLDAGNTVIKAVLFDLEGRQVAMHAVDGHSKTPEPGHVERDLDELWSNARTVIGRCIRVAAIDPREIAGVGCAGHGNGLYLLDRAGRPLLGIQSLDSRATAVAAELDAAIGDEVHPISLQRPWPAQTPVLMAWLKRHRPELWAGVGTAFLCKDYITWRLTGERVSETSDMSGCGLISTETGEYDNRLLDLVGLSGDRDILPPLIDPVDIAGRITRQAAEATGLAEGTPVIGGYFDVISSAIGSGVVRHGEASIIAGSWSINQVFSAAPVVDQRLFMTSRFGPGRYVTIESSATSAANLEWYVREFVERGQHHADPFGACTARLAEVTPAADDPLFHPFLFGARDGAAYRAGFYGISGWHGEGHMMRALFEGVAFEHRRHIERLAGAGLRITRAVLAGGGSRSPVWPQIFADVLDFPISTAEARETGALGAAIGVGVAMGHFADYEDGIAHATRQEKTYDPQPELTGLYGERYGLYLELIASMRAVWDRLDAARRTREAPA
jgi:L-xylulokinase